MKTGVKVAELMVNPVRSAFDEAALVTVIVYVFTVPSWAVTDTVIVLVPTLRVTGADALPLVTTVPFTFTDAFGSDTTGVTVIDVTVLDTKAV